MEIAEELEQGISIKIAGIGRKGAKAVGKMTDCVKDVEFLVLSEDSAEIVDLSKRGLIRFLDSIAYSSAVGSDITGGGGADEDSIDLAVRNADLVFIVTGNENHEVDDMSVSFAKASRDAGAFTIAVTTGDYEGDGVISKLGGVADFHRLSTHVDSFLTISNDCLVPQYDDFPQILSEPALADYLIRHAVGKVGQCATERGIICLDFYDMRIVLGDGDRLHMGIGIADGTTKGKDAAVKAVQGLSRQGMDIIRSTGVLVSVEGSTNMTMDDYDEATRVFVKMLPEDTNIIFGCYFNDALGGNAKVTVFAGFSHGKM